MKKIIFIAAIVAACGVIHAAQDTSLTERELRDPKQLQPWLEANASDAQTRLTALESSTSVTASVIGDFAVASNLTVGGTAVLTGVVASDDITCDKIIFTDAITAAPTNALSAGFLITVQGTNYWLGLYPVND